MQRILFFAVVAVIAAVLAAFALFGGRSSQAAASVTDLVVGQPYQVADFRLCSLSDGSKATEWHFGGADRSRRNQLTPRLDGRGRRVMRVVTNDPTLPAGHMRLRRVEESAADPTLEGFTYGDYQYNWSGLVVEYNGSVEAQSVVGPCGPARENPLPGGIR